MHETKHTHTHTHTHTHVYAWLNASQSMSCAHDPPPLSSPAYPVITCPMITYTNKTLVAKQRPLSGSPVKVLIH